MTSLDMMRRVIDAQVDNDTDVDAVGRQIEPCLNERRSPGVALAWEPLGTRALAVCDHDGINIRVLNIYLLIDILGHMVNLLEKFYSTSLVNVDRHSWTAVD